MSELRLVPLAVLLWAATAMVVLRHPGVAIALVIAFSLGAVTLRSFGQAILLGCGGSVATVISQLRVRAVGVDTPERLRGVIADHPKRLSDELWLLKVDDQGYPVSLPVLFRGAAPPAAGATVEATVQARPSERAGLVAELLTARDLTVVAPPHGWQAITGQVRRTFAQASEFWLGVEARGLVPGMVLGDTNMQSEADRHLYIETGLSHLTAVSGSNVALLVTIVFTAARLLTLSPRVQVFAAAVALIGFLGLVGLEPSVLRAGVTGMVGLLAVMNSSKMQPIHGLSLAVSGLVLWDSDLAVQYGFALSVAATGGIVALQPMLVPALARVSLFGRRMPDVVVRALGVAIAADVVTAPILAMMTGTIPLVSVLANILSAPVVGVITVLGLVAVGCSLLPGGLESIALFLVEPCARWIHLVAVTLHGPQLSAPVSWVLLGSAWIVYLFYRGWGRWVLRGAAAATLVWLLPGVPLGDRPEEIPLHQLNVVTEQKIGGGYEPPAGTDAVVVLDGGGKARDRPTRTKGGVPVLFPNRDGEVALYSDGTQHARDGRF